MHGRALDDYVTCHGSRRKEIAVFWAVRALLAPLIEGVILLDRALYLAECGAEAELLPLFDPAISPRNFVTVGHW